MEIIVFNLLNEEYGLKLENVREVLRVREIHPLPKAPDFIEGVINIRGHIIAVIDLRKKFGISDAKESPKVRVIICKLGKFIVGIVVDSVSEVINVEEESIEPTPGVVSTQVEENCVSGIARIGERVIMLLDSDKILTKEEAKSLSKTKKSKKN